MGEYSLSISLFGEFSMSYSCGDTVYPLTDKIIVSKKMCLFLQYLCANRARPVPQSEMIEILWDDEEISDPANALKVILFRVRKIFDEMGFPNAKKVIMSRSSTYYFNADIELNIDTEQFEDLFADGFSGKRPEIEAFKDAIDLYTGNFLPSCEGQSWATNLRVYYHSKYVKMCNKVASMLIDNGKYETAIDLCQKSLLIVPYEESLHAYLIIGLLKSGAEKSALEHYNLTIKLFMDYLGVSPTHNILDLYQQILDYAKPVKKTPYSELQKLIVENEKSGAFYCEYGIFKEIFKITDRSLQRTDKTVGFGIVSMDNFYFIKNTRNQREKETENIKDVIVQTLRVGDVVTKINPYQFLIMFVDTNNTDLNNVLSRIVNKFYSKYSSSKAILSFEKSNYEHKA